MTNSPWAPLYTIKRSEVEDVTVNGIIQVVDGQDKTILSVGNANQFLWSRSLLKPWQLLFHLPELIQSYPDLQLHHYALMLGSHSGEASHIEKLSEISEIGGVSETFLQCPASYPMSPESKYELKRAGVLPKSLYHNCSGKHFGYLLAIKSKHANLGNYLDRTAEHFEKLKSFCAWVNDESPQSLRNTTDGCLLPNFGFSARRLAKMFCELVSGIGSDKLKSMPRLLGESIEMWDRLKDIMITYPVLVGGSNRLDSQLMQGELTDNNLQIVAKEGADGLLTMGIGPSKSYPSGLGILVKLASGYNSSQTEVVVKALLEQLNLRKATTEKRPNHLKEIVHFSVSKPQAVL